MDQLILSTILNLNIFMILYSKSVIFVKKFD